MHVIAMALAIAGLSVPAAIAVPEPRSEEELRALSDLVIVADVVRVTHDGFQADDGSAIHTVRFRVRRVEKGCYPFGAIYRHQVVTIGSSRRDPACAIKPGEHYRLYLERYPNGQYGTFGYECIERIAAPASTDS